MSYGPRPPAGRPYGPPSAARGDTADGAKGSVRAAREWLEGAQRTRSPDVQDPPRIVGLPQRPNQLVSHFSAQAPAQDLLSPPSNHSSVYSSPSPQWPLSTDAEGILDGDQRPPELPPQQPSPRGAPGSDYDLLSPSDATLSSRPLTTSSAASEASSLGSIPDFPVPAPPMPTIQSLPRRSPNLGPPPSARRGPSSYYPQTTYVSPIAEEAETRSDRGRSLHSFASSNVIPMHTADFNIEEDVTLSDDDVGVPSDDEARAASPASTQHDRAGLVRQASLGRRTKPALTTIKSRDPKGDAKANPAPKKKKTVGAFLTAGRESPSRTPSGSSFGASNPPSPVDASPLSESPAGSRLKIAMSANDADADADRSGMRSPVQVLQAAAPRQTSLAERVGMRRPPRLNLDAVREAEARGSLTSLPELIRRATRLAANLDRGKTASRLGLDFWENGAPDKEMGRSLSRSGSLTDMLAAFPPPGDATPTGEKSPARRASPWPSGLGQREDAARSATPAAAKRGSPQKRPARRCCGMARPVFITLLVVLLFLIAAAVVIPIVLIVVPKSRAASNNAPAKMRPSATASPAATGSAGQCNGSLACQNGGVAVQTTASGSCSCVCINGFSGPTCGSAADAACMTADVGGTANATVGAGIPRIVSAAETQFNIGLDGSSLLALFSQTNLSCASENALVTFNGLASRSALADAEPAVHGEAEALAGLVDDPLEPAPSVPSLVPPHPELRADGALDARQTVGGTTARKGSYGAAPASSAVSATAPAPVSQNLTAIEFARVGVLVVLQASGQLDPAASAQEALQTFLANDAHSAGSGKGSKAAAVDLGNNFSIDLVRFRVTLANGTALPA